MSSNAATGLATYGVTKTEGAPARAISLLLHAATVAACRTTASSSGSRTLIRHLTNPPRLRPLPRPRAAPVRSAPPSPQGHRPPR